MGKCPLLESIIDMLMSLKSIPSGIFVSNSFRYFLTWIASGCVHMRKLRCSHRSSMFVSGINRKGHRIRTARIRTQISSRHSSLTKWLIWRQWSKKSISNPRNCPRFGSVFRKNQERDSHKFTQFSHQSESNHKKKVT